MICRVRVKIGEILHSWRAGLAICFIYWWDFAQGLCSLKYAICCWIKVAWSRCWASCFPSMGPYKSGGSIRGPKLSVCPDWDYLRNNFYSRYWKFTRWWLPRMMIGWRNQAIWAEQMYTMGCVNPSSLLPKSWTKTHQNSLTLTLFGTIGLPNSIPCLGAQPGLSSNKT